MCRSPTVLDTKCKYIRDFKCWYCNESCEICLEPTVLGPAYIDSTEGVLRFCSDTCCDIYKRKPKIHSEVFSPDDQDNANRKVPVGHKEYLHISSCGKRDSGDSFIMNVSLCEGDGSETFPLHQYYVNYHLRSPRHHGHYEFFISNDLQALDSVSYSGASCDLLKKEDVGNIRKSAVDAISRAVRNLGCSSISDLLEKIRLRGMMGSNIAAHTIGGDKKNKPQAAAKLSTDLAQEPCTVKSGQGPMSDVNVHDKDHQIMPTLVVTSDQLLAILSQCGGDQDKFVEKIQELVASGSESTPGLSLSQDSRQKDHGEPGESVVGGGARNVAMAEGKGKVLDGPRLSGTHTGGCKVQGEKEQVSEKRLEESVEPDQQDEESCKVQ